METELYNKIENYIHELDHMSDFLNSMNFASDTAQVYSEVSKKLRLLIEH